MTIEEKVKKMNEMLAEVNNLAKEIDEEINKKQADDTDMLSIYINDIEGTSIQYWVDSNGEVDAGMAEYKPDDYNPYSNYISNTYAKTAARMKKFNDMLLAFKWCYDTSYAPNWGDSDSLKYFIYYDTDKSVYMVDSSYVFAKNDVYFSTRIRAEDCADWLNKVDPEGELVK